MKVLSLSSCILITAILLFPGCKKDSDEEPPAPVCRVQTLTESSVVISYVYDSAKRVSKAIYSDGHLAEYKYKGDTTRILKTSGGAFDRRLIIINNAQGMAVLVRIEENPAGTDGVIISYQYNGTEMIQSIQKSIGSANANVTNYTWSAGNLIEIKNNGSTTTLDYYTDKLNQPGNYLEAVNLSQGYVNFKTKNLVKTVAQSTSTTITYVFDSHGNISRAEFSNSSGNAIDFTYQCD
jgi:hypothetical protein